MKQRSITPKEADELKDAGWVFYADDALWWHPKLASHGLPAEKALALERRAPPNVVVLRHDGRWRALARFRVDPNSARIAVRKCEEPGGTVFVVTIEERSGVGRTVRARSRRPRSAVLRALLAADKENLVGVDLTMSRAFDHPQWEATSP